MPITNHFRNPPRVPATPGAGGYVIKPTQLYGESPDKGKSGFWKRNNIPFAVSQTLCAYRQFPTSPYRPPSLWRRLVRRLLRLGRSGLTISASAGRF